MRDSATPTRDAPLRRLAFLGLVFVATILSCAKDVTGPSTGRFMRGFSWNTIFPKPLRDIGSAGTGVVPFSSVRVLLHHSDGTVALDTVITYPSGADSLIVSLNVKLLSSAPASGEPMTADLAYLNATGDTVFKGGPIALTAAPAPAGGGTNPPVQIPVAYTGPGASATSVAITPHNSSVVASSGFTLSATAKDAAANVLPGTPFVWTSLDTTIATITSPGAGTGVAKAIRGTARIVAQLVTGAGADTAQVVVTLPASQIVKPSTASGDAQTGIAGVALAQPVVAKVAASDGVGVAGTTVTFAVATGGGSVAPLTSVSDANGLAQTTWTLGTGAGAQSITAAAGTLTNSPLTYTATATAGVATKLVVTTQPAGATGGAIMPSIVVTAQDANGNVATTFTGAVLMGLGTTTSGALLGGTASVNAVAGVATFSTLTINKAFVGYTLVASSGTLTPATSAAFNIAVGAAVSISTVGGNAQTGPVGGALPTPIAVRVVDAGSNGVAGKTVTFATTDGSVAPTSIATDANGLAITTWTLGATVGSQSMTATSTGLTSSPLTITAAGAVVTATKLVFTTVPVTASGGITLPGVVLAAEDASGNLASTFTGAVTLALGTTTSGAVLGGTVTVNAVAGVATFSTLNINKTFTGYTLVATATGLTGATSPTFDITTGPAAAIVSAGGTGQTGTISTLLPTPIAVRVTDAGGNGVSGKAVTFLTTFGSVTPTSGVTDANGLVGGINWTLGSTIGTQSMTANSTGVPGSPLQITATGTAAVAGPATQLVFMTQPSTAASLAANSPSIVVRALDVNSLLATTFTGNVTLAIGTNPGSSTIGGTVTVAAVTGVATFSNVTLNKVGTGYTLVASATALTSATSSAFNVTPGPAANLAIAAGNNQTALAGTAVPTAPGVTVTDASGNAVSGVGVTFVVASGGGSVIPSSSVSTNGSGQAFATTWTLGATPGSQTLSATSLGLAGSPATFTATATVAGLKTWTGATSATWAIATNWSPSGAPASTDSVFVPFVTNLPNLTTSATIKALTLAPSATLTITGAPLTVTSSLDATGGIIGTGGVTLTSATGATVKGTMTQTATIQGLYAVNGAFAAGGLQVNSGSLDLNGQAVVIGANGLGTGGTATIIMNQAGSTLTTTGGATFAGGDETGKLTAGTLSVGGNFSESGGGTAFNAGTAHTLILNGSTAASLSMADPTTSIIGNLIINDAAGVSVPSGFIANNVTITTGALTGTGGATINGTLTDPLAHWAAGNIIFATSTTPVSASTPSITPASSVTFANNPSNLAANLTINGSVNAGGNVVPNGHTLTINGAFATVGANGQLTMTNSSDVVSVTGNVTFGASGTGGLMTAGTLNIGGNFMQSGGAQSINTSGTNTVVFNGAGTQTVIFSSPDGNFAGGACVGDACFQNVTSSKSSGALNFLTTVKVQGNFTNSNSAGATIQTPVSNGPLIISGNALFGVSGTYYKTGIGGSGFSKGAGTVIDSVYYFGSGQAYSPATLGESFSDIRGTSSWTSPGTLTGQMIVDGNGQLNVANGSAPAVITGNFTTSGSGTLKMTTNATDTLAIGGNATFGGGATTGLLTTGNIVVSGATVTNTGQAFDASGTQTTTFNATTGTQTLNWISPVASHGYNNITLRGAALRQFGAAQYINGNMLIAATSGNVNGSWVLTFAGNITDSTANRNAWNGSSVVVMTGTPTVLPRNFVVNTLTFSGGTVALNDSLKGVGYIIVDGTSSAAHLKLNGHYVGLSGNFTTQNGGVLEMTNTHDTLDVAGGVTFNGGSTAGLLTHGYMNVGSPGFTQGGPNPGAFSADSTLRVSIGRGNGTQITFATPGFGPGASHFGELMVGDGSTHTLNSDVFVQGQLTTNSGPQFPITSANHLITAQGANATHLYLTDTRLLFADGSPISVLTDLRFSSMDPTVTQLEVRRSGTAGTGDFAATLNSPVFNTTPTSGLYLEATDTTGTAPFLTITVSSPTPAITGGLASALSGAVINGWPATLAATWLGVTSAWNSTSNWNTGLVPTAGTDVAINCDCTAPITSTSVAVHNLTMGGTGIQLTLGSSGPLTVNGDLSVASGSDINTGSASVTLLGNVTMDPTSSPGGVFCGTGTTGAILLGTGTQNVTGKFCRLTVGSSVVASGAIVVKNNTAGDGGLTMQSGGNITFNSHRVETDSMYTVGTGTITMTQANDSLVIHGANVGVPVYFNGGSTTGLITNGTVVDHSPGFQVNGTAFDAANGLNTIVADSGTYQGFKWIGASIGHGINNLLAKNTSKSFTSDLVINGTLTLDPSMTTSGQFDATGYNLYAGGVVDNTGNLSGGLSGAYWMHLIGSGGVPAIIGVDSIFFESGGNMQLTSNVTTNGVVVVRPDVLTSSNTGLLLNGHRLTTTNHDFITTGSAFLGMINAADSLDVGTANVFFNGGGYSSVLTAGGIAAGGFYQGYTNTTTLASGTAVNSYNPSGTHRLWLTQNAKIIFANPGTGSSLSHFNTLRNPSGYTSTLYSDVFVDDSIYFATSGTAIFNSDQPSVAGKTRRITTQGLADNTTSTGIEFNNVALKWVDGQTAPSHFDNVQWTGFPLLYSGTVFEVNRFTSAVPTFASHDFLAVVTSGLSGGSYVLNSSPSTGPVLNFTSTLGLLDFSLTFGQHNP